MSWLDKCPTTFLAGGRLLLCGGRRRHFPWYAHSTPDSVGQNGLRGVLVCATARFIGRSYMRSAPPPPLSLEGVLWVSGKHCHQGLVVG